MQWQRVGKNVCSGEEFKSAYWNGEVRDGAVAGSAEVQDAAGMESKVVHISALMASEVVCVMQWW